MLLPVTLQAYETEYGKQYALSFYQLWMENKPPNLSWYVYDVIIHSPTKVEFISHRMLDTAFGGVGDENGRFIVECDQSLTRPHIESKARELAREKRRVELAAIETEIIEQYQKDILDEFDNPSEKEAFNEQ